MATPGYLPRSGYPSSYGGGNFNQNRSYMQYLQKLANRMAAEQILEEQTAQQEQPQLAYDPRSYFNQPEMPYLTGLSPMARFRDMGLRDQGRQAIARSATQETMANQGLIEDSAMGVTRQPNGAVTTEAGFISAPEMGQRTLMSKYGQGSSTMGTTPPTGGTFGFTDSSGSHTNAPFAALKDPRYLKYMQEEEAANRMASSRPAQREVRTFEDVMNQLDSIR